MSLQGNQVNEAFAVAAQYFNQSEAYLFGQQSALQGELYKRKDQVKTGKTFIQIPVYFQKNPNMGSNSGTLTTVNTPQPTQQTTFGQFEWKFYDWQLALTKKEWAQGSGSMDAVLDLVGSKTIGTMNDFANLVALDMFGDNASNPDNIDGLGNMSAASGISYANLNNNDVPNWYPVKDTTSQVINYSNINKVLSQLTARIQTSPKNVMTKDVRPNFIVSNPYVRAQFMDSEQIKTRYVAEKDLDTGFDKIFFNSIPWYADSFCPGSGDGSTADNYLYILALDTFKLWYRWGFTDNDGNDVPTTDGSSPFDYNAVVPVGGYRAMNKSFCFNMGTASRYNQAVMTALKS